MKEALKAYTLFKYKASQRDKNEPQKSDTKNSEKICALFKNNLEKESSLVIVNKNLTARSVNIFNKNRLI